MKSRDDLNSTAIHEAAHVAACINLDLEFDAVYLETAQEHPGLVAKLAKKANIDYSSGVLTPEEESLSTNLVIVGFAGPAVDALHRGRTAFDITEYDDLNEVLDAIEYRFANNNVRIAFTHYCEAEAFALFEDDRRLWRFTHLLARELARQKKLTYAQCMELYSKEYLAESWVRKEVDEIREGEAKHAEEEARKGDEGIAANYEQRAASIENAPKEGRGQRREAAGGKPQAARGEAGRGPKKEVPVQDREAPKHEDIVEGAAAGGDRPEEGDQQERRGRRRRRGRGRGRGKKREGAAPEPVLEALPGEVIGGQPVGEAASDKGEAASPKLPATSEKSQANNQQKQPQQNAQRPPLPVAKAADRKAEPSQNAPVQGGAVPTGAMGTPPPLVNDPADAPAPAGEAPVPQERPKIQLIKAVKTPVSEVAPVEAPKPAETPAPEEVVVPPMAEPRPLEAAPAIVPEVSVPGEAPAAAEEQPKRRLAVSGKTTEGTAVRGRKGTSHPDSIWEGEEAASDKPQAESEQPQPIGDKRQNSRAKTPGTRGKAQGSANKLQASGDKPQAARETPPAAPVEAARPEAVANGKKPVKAAKPRTTKAAKTAAPAVEAPAKPTKAAKATKAAPPVAETPAPKPTKAARPVKAAKTAKAAAPAPEAPVKKARTAPAKKVAPAKAAPKKAAAKKPAAKKSGK